MNTINTRNPRIGVIGAGSWGTALACLLGDKGYPVDLWVFEPEIQEEIQRNRENTVFLPGVTIPPYITPTLDLKQAVNEKDAIVIVVPSHVMRRITLEIAKHLADPPPIFISAAKGIEDQTYLTMIGIMRETLPLVPPDHFAALSGPTFAREVARKVPSAVTAAAVHPQVAAAVQSLFSTPFFRVYTTEDIIGVELGGAMKNIIAIAAGIIDGLGLGLNTRAATITRGLAEIRRLGTELGADPLTFSGLAGVGDLILTCTGNLSRNYTVGKKLGAGMAIKDILSEMKMVAEGVKNAKSIYNLAHSRNVDLPISTEVYKILYESAAPREAVYRLMTRDLKPELYDLKSTPATTA